MLSSFIRVYVNVRILPWYVCVRSSFVICNLMFSFSLCMYYYLFGNQPIDNNNINLLTNWLHNATWITKIMYFRKVRIRLNKIFICHLPERREEVIQCVLCWVAEIPQRPSYRLHCRLSGSGCCVGKKALCLKHSSGENGASHGIVILLKISIELVAY